MKPAGAGGQWASGFLLLAALAGCQPDSRPAETKAATVAPAAADSLAVPDVLAKAPELAPALRESPDTARTAADLAAAALEAEAEAACPPKPITFVRNKWIRRPAVVRRYLGRVGTEPAMALLAWQHPDSIRGSFCLLRDGTEYTVEFTEKPRRPIKLAIRHEHPDFSSRGTWQLAGKPGAAITGTWVEGAARKKIVLHEDYTKAVRCEILTLRLTGGRPESGGVYGFRCSVPSWSQDYLHLLENVARHPALRQLQCPPERTRRHQQLREYERAGEGGWSIQVRLNGFGLLSYALWYEEMPFGGRRQNSTESKLFDLTTGRALPLASQLQPSYEPMLCRLLLRHLLHDLNRANGIIKRTSKDTHYPIDSLSMNEAGPNSLVLTGAGLEASYFPEDLYAVLGPEISVYAIPYNVLIPYAELRPLVRPGTPLARMLTARKIW